MGMMEGHGDGQEVAAEERWRSELEEKDVDEVVSTARGR